MDHFETLSPLKALTGLVFLGLCAIVGKVINRRDDLTIWDKFEDESPTIH